MGVWFICVRVWLGGQGVHIIAFSNFCCFCAAVNCPVMRWKSKLLVPGNVKIFFATFLLIVLIIVIRNGKIVWKHGPHVAKF